MRLYACLLLLGLAASAAPPVISVTVKIERKDGDRWLPADARTVFASGTRVRFAFSSAAPGYLYVLNQSPEGEVAVLFPTEDAGTDNSIVPGKTYLIPVTNGSYLLEGEPGFETLYWIVSTTPLSVDRLVQARRHTTTPSSTDRLLPKCYEELRARGGGGCMDSRAGFGAVSKTNPMVSDGVALPLRAREIRIERDDEKTRITPSRAEPSTLVYEVRLAHR